MYFPEFRRNIAKESELNRYITERLYNLLKERPSAGMVITGDINQLDPRSLCRRFDLWKIVKARTRGNNILDQSSTSASLGALRSSVYPLRSAEASTN